MWTAVERLKGQYPLRRLCRVLKVSRSGYYRRQRQEETQRVREDRHLKQQILTIHGEAKGRYGTPRIEQELRRQGIGTSQRRVGRFRQELGLRAKAAKKYQATTDSAHRLPVAPNRLQRCFQAPAPNHTWVGDITYLWTPEGWVYLAILLDIFSRRIVGWSLSESLEQDLTVTALESALATRSPGPGLLLHSDRGSQYASHDYRELAEGAGLVLSMSREGDCWDNAMAQSLRPGAHSVPSCSASCGPASRRSSASSTPPTAPTEAKLCRRSWIRTSSSPARCRSRLQDLPRLPKGFPACPKHTYGLPSTFGAGQQVKCRLTQQDRFLAGLRVHQAQTPAHSRAKASCAHSKPSKPLQTGTLES